MDKRASYMLQVLEKIGLPLMEASLSPVKGQDRHTDINVQVAQDGSRMAGLLSRTVSTSIALAPATQMEKLGEDGSDAMRLALAGIAAPMIAGLYKHGNSADLPDEKATQRLSEMLKHVVKFSETFSAGTDEIARLAALQAEGAAVDEAQVAVQYMQALSPLLVLPAMDEKAMGEVTQRLNARAADLRKTFNADADKPTASRMELAILRSIVPIYVACSQEANHDATKAWEAFELRSEILCSITRTLVTGDVAAATPAAPVSAPPVSAPPTEAKEEVAPPVTPPPVSTEAPKAEPPAEAPPAAGANPMAMFSKKPAAESEGKPAESAPPEPPTAPVTPPSPPTEPPAAPPPSAPPSASPSAPPSEKKEDDANAGGNPMAFFAGKKKTEDE